MPERPDRTRLPIRRPAFTGVTAKTLAGSEPDWGLIGHAAPPEGAPNVLVVLIDDAGFGNPSTFGGPIETPNYALLFTLAQRDLVAESSSPPPLSSPGPDDAPLPAG